nr:polymerase [Phlebovirus sp.]
MNDILLKQPELRPGFTKRELRHYDETLFGVGLPEFSISRVKDQIDLEIAVETLDDRSTVGSTLLREPLIRIDPKNSLNFVHDFTYGHLCNSTDRRFSTVFPIMNDGFDNLSPDLIIQTTAGGHHVVEFTTFRGTEKGARNAANLKFGKYEVACENRAGQAGLALHVISTHISGVWSNLDLEEEEANEMIFRYRLAISIFEELKIMFPELRADDDELGKQERAVLGVVSSITMDWDVTEDKFPSFKKRMFDLYNSKPSDGQYMTKIVADCLEKSQKDLEKSSFISQGRELGERLMLNNKEACAMVEESIQSYEVEGRMRGVNDPKSTVQLPPWIMTEWEEGKSLSSLRDLNIEGDHPMCEIWKRVVLSATLEEITRMYDDPEAELEFAMSGALDRPDERSKYHRVRLDLPDDISEHIAALGVGGKQFKDRKLVVDSRNRSKLGFSPCHNIDSLEGFLHKPGKRLFEPMEDLYSPLTEDYELRIAAQMIHQPTLTYNEGPNEMLSAHMRFMSSSIGSWSQMVSLIGAELSASVKQHVKQKSFVVKRLLNSGLFLLIKPTSSKSHIFVSLALLKHRWSHDLDDGTVFKAYIDAGDMFITEFVSFKLSKLTNLCKCNSLLESALCYWTECNGGNPWDICSNDAPHPDTSFMFKLSMLTLMEDKATTEEIQTMMRYVVMEGFVSQPEIPKPQKMLSKLPKILRSELQVFLLQCFMRSIRKISFTPFALSKVGGSVTWTNLFNPFSGRHLKDVQPLISCCYNGYFKNKEEETEPSVLSKMYKKIIELEDMRPESDEYLGWADPSDPKMHEFSVSYLKDAVSHAKQLLKKIYGQNALEQIDNEILREVSSLTLERLATLKATSNFDENWYVYKDVKDKNYTRDKVLVKMSEFANEGKTLAIEKFDECMKSIELRGGMHICLFKKQQHGGLREIYVLGAEERIVQSIIEIISRSIGRFFPSDTLCNPNNKMKIPETHGIRARKHCKGPVWTCATSDDAKKWNQGHFVTKFALMLCDFTSPKWWPIIIRGCSMFTNKLMMMNLGFLRILDNHRELDIQDEFVQDLFKAYHGEHEVSWAEKGRTYLKTSTGMMQGILHFTSSLLHTIHQEYIRSLSFKIFNLKISPDAGSQIVCDMMQGSDDSSMIISFPSSDRDLLQRYKVAAAVCFRMKKNLGVFLGIYPSEKSTSNTDFAMEYNSEFFFHSQHVRPTIRWIAACCSLPEVETLVARQEEAANLMTSVSEGGGSFSLSAMVQQAQCTLHYMLMGMGLSLLFKEYKKAILRWEDPGLGFFLLDNPYAAGLGGFRYNLYKAITTTSLQKIYAYFMKKVKGPQSEGSDGSIISETCSVSPGGALILSSSLKWGSRKKFQKLRSRLNIPENWIELINENPDVLYRAPKTGEEIMLRIAEKLHSPGVVSSLSTGNAVCKVMASAVYFLSAAIFEDTGRPEFSFLENSKYSLLQKMAAYEGFDGVGDIEPEDIIFLFPNVEEFETLDSIIRDKGRIELAVRTSSREATQTRVIVFDHHQSQRSSPEKLVSDKWFGTQKSKIGRTAFNEEWSKLKKIVKWLGDDPAITLENTPLHNHIQVRNFFARMEGKTRTVRVTGAPVKKRSGLSKLAIVIRDNFSKMGFLKGIEDVSGMTRGMSSELCKHALFTILQGPYSESSKLKFISEALRNLPKVNIKESDGKTKTNTIGILQEFYDGNRDLVQLIEKVGAGTLGGFVRPQQSKNVNGSVVYYGRGIWRGTMDGVQVQIEVFNEIGNQCQISSVTVYGTQSPWELSQSIRSWAEDMGAKNNVDLSRDSRKGARFWLMNFKMYGPSHPYGCPVYVSSQKMTDFAAVRSQHIDIKIRRSTINLFTKEKFQNRDLHILSYTSNDSDLSPASLNSMPQDELSKCLPMLGREPSTSWIKCKSVPFKLCSSVIALTEKKKTVDYIDTERLGEIIKICTESALRVKVGTIFSLVPTAEEASANVDLSAVLDMMIEDAAADAFEEVVKSMKEESDLESGYDIEEFDPTDLNLFGPAHFKELSNLAMISHPLMDSLVDTVVEKMGRQVVRRLLERGVTTSGYKELASILYRAIQRDPQSIIIEDVLVEDDSDVEDDILG